MATTIVSNLAVFSDASGGSNQVHFFYATNQQRWWCFVISTKTATGVDAYVSSSNDLTTATWSKSTSSPAFPSSRALTTSDERNMGCLFLNPSLSLTTDAAHIEIIISTAAPTQLIEHIRCTFTGSASISWDAAWNETNPTSNAQNQAVHGPSLGLSSSGFFHGGGPYSQDGNAQARRATNADTGASWTNGFGADATIDNSAAAYTSAFALAPISAAAAMIAVYDDGATMPNCAGLRYQKYASGTTWPTSSSAAVPVFSGSQDKNDWCLVAVDTTHIYAIRKSGSNTFAWQKFDGVSTWSTPANNIPSQAQLAGSGMTAVPDGLGNFYLFVLDGVGNSAIKYTICLGANTATPTWTPWATLEAAGATARNYISGCRVAGNNQIGVIYTAVNGANFDIVVSAVSTVLPAPSVGPRPILLAYPDPQIHEDW